MRHSLTLSVFIFTLILGGCLSSNDPGKTEESKQQVSSSAQSTNQTFDEFDLSNLDGKFPNWTALWQKHLPDFDLAKMTERETKAYKPDYVYDEPFDLPEESDEFRRATGCRPIHERTYISPDQSRFIYVNPFCGGPDSDVIFIDEENKRYERLAFCGTVCGYGKAVWINNHSIAVSGYSEYYPPDDPNRCTVGEICTVIPTLIIFDLQKNIVTSYEGPEVDREEYYLK